MKRYSDQEIESMLRGDERVEPPPELLDLLRTEIPQQLGGDAGDDSADDAAGEAPSPEPSNVVAFPRRRWLLAAASVLFAAGASILTYRLGAPQESLSGVAEHDVAAQGQGIEAVPQEQAEPARRSEARPSEARPSEEEARLRANARLIEGAGQKKVQKARSAGDEGDFTGGLRAQESAPRGPAASPPTTGDGADPADALAGLEMSSAEPSSAGSPGAESSPAPDAAFADAADDSPADLGAEAREREDRVELEQAGRFAPHEGLDLQGAASGSSLAPPEDRSADQDSAAGERKDAERDESPTAGPAKKEQARSAAASPRHVDFRHVDSRRVAELHETVDEAAEASLWRPGSLWGEVLAAVEGGQVVELDAERLETLRAALAGHPRLQDAGLRLLEIWHAGTAEPFVALITRLRRLEKEGVAGAAEMRRLAERLVAEDGLVER